MTQRCTRGFAQRRRDLPKLLGLESIPLEAHLLPTAPRSPPPSPSHPQEGAVTQGHSGKAGRLRTRVWPALSPAPSARCQAVPPTFLGFLKTIVLCEPLSIGHIDVILKFGVLLTQGEGLGEGVNAVFRIRPPPPPRKHSAWLNPLGMSYFAGLTTQMGGVPPPTTTTPRNAKTNQLFENKRQLTAICKRLDSITTQSVSGPQKRHRIGNILF